MGLLDRFRRPPAAPEPATPPDAPAGQLWRGVTETAFHRAALPDRAGSLELEIYALKRRNPPELAVRWNGKRVGTLGTSATVYLHPLIEQLQPESRVLRTAGWASWTSEVWNDGSRRIALDAQIPTKEEAARLVAL